VSRLAMITSMLVGKYYYRFVGVMLVVSSGNRAFQRAIAEIGTWRGYLSRVCVIRCWSDVCTSGYVSA